MKPMMLLLFACLSHISYADSDITFSEDIFSAESLQQLYEVLECSNLPSHSVQLTSTTSLSTVAVINDYVDKLITKIQSVIVNNGMDTVNLPDVSLSFKRKYILVTYTGILNLTDGNVTNVSSISRNGDVVVSYNNKYLNLEVPLTFDELNIKYHYRAKFLNIGPSGEVIGKVSSTTFKFAVGFNFTGHAVNLNEFTLTNIGNINLSFKGNPLIDWFLRIITNLVTSLFKGTIQQVVEGNVYSVIVGVIEALNEALQSLRQ